MLNKWSRYCGFLFLSLLLASTGARGQSVSISASGSTTVCPGTQVSFTALALNTTGTITYTWRRNGIVVTSSIVGPPPQVLVYSGVQNGDVFNCQISTSTGQSASSNSITITVSAPTPFAVTVGPDNITYCQGAAVHFTSNSTFLVSSYQWYMNGSSVGGATTSTLNTTASSVAQLKSVTLYATTSSTCASNNSANNNASSLPFTVNPIVAPSETVTASPTGSVCPGVGVVFTANPVNGGISPTYQWSMNGSPAGTGPTFTTPASSVTQLQSVSVVLTSNASCLSSTTATGNASSISFAMATPVVPSVSISANPAGSVCSGNPITYTAVPVNGGTSPAYQWKINGSAVGGATGSSFTSSSLTNGQQVSVTMTSNLSCVSPSSVTSNLLTAAVSANVTTPAAPAGPVTASQGLSYSYSGSGGNAASYSWALLPSNAGTINSSGVATFNGGFVGTATIQSVAVGCGGSSSPSSANVTLYRSLKAGSLTPFKATVPSGSSPGLLTASPASGGNCGGAFQYQWQKSTDSIIWANVADTDLIYDPGNITSPAYYRVRMSCGSDTVLTNVCQLLTGAVSPDLNYVRERTVMKPGVTDTTTVQGLTDPLDVSMATTYFDGLGRPVQKVSWKASPLLKDMVSMQTYDPFGRENVAYLPYVSVSNDGNFKANALGESRSFNSMQFPGEQYYYGQTTFESTESSRPLSVSAPGLSWTGSGRANGSQYVFNELADSVKIWDMSLTAGGRPSNVGVFPAGRLYKTIVTDERGVQVVDYKDKLGHVLLKKVQLSNAPTQHHTGWLCTYYIYDDLDNLRWVISPKAVVWLQSNSWNFANSGGSTVADELCFRYEYDTRRRMTIKKVPGAGEVRMVYDARDRLVMSQDSVLRSQQKWLVTCYDALNRPDSVALMTDPVHYNDPAWHQNLANTWAYPYYPNTAGYVTELQVQTYYDNYDWLAPLGTSLSAAMNTTYNNNAAYFLTTYNASPSYAVPIDAYSSSRGLMTGTRSKVVGTSQYLYNIPFYDDHGRVIQTESTNYTNATDLETTQYDFSGKPLRKLLVHRKNGTNPMGHLFATRWTYDAGGRLTSIWKNMDGTQRRIDTLFYNELGQLRAKYLGSNLDSLVFDYNIRGWTTGINKRYLAGTATNYFGMELAYDKSASVTGNTVFTGLQYNGNITGVVWKSAGDGVGRKYDYGYDNLNRLVIANYSQSTGGTFAKSALLDFTVRVDQYDENGNIRKMKHNGYKIGGSDLIDNLVYAYQNNSNKLQQVYDSANDVNSLLGDFHYDPATKGSTDYTYDGNGNLIADKNKAIRSIQYNFMNLPQLISFTKADGSSKGNIQYRYDAMGSKVFKIITDSTVTPVRITNILYVREVQYQNDTLQFAGHEEGRTRFGFQYYENGDSSYRVRTDYFEKDHLGNTRIVLTEQRDTAKYMATMEAAFRNKERALFYNIDETSYPAASVPGGGFPSDGQPGPNDSVARVNGSSRPMGPGILLKVMSGDSVLIGVNGYFRSGGSTSQTQSALPDILSSLATGLVSMTGGSHGAIGDLNNMTNSPVYAALNSFNSGNITTPGTTPKAYLNWMLLDNQFQYVSADGQSGALGITIADMLNIKGTSVRLKKSGYLYIWVSNETKNWDVFFDKLTVRTFSGPLLEENHYYPFGLTMAGISDKALKGKYVENKKRYNKGAELQNKEFVDGSGLEMYETPLRELDPQLGRWWQIDPKPNYSESPYAAMKNNPLLFNDPLGDTIIVNVGFWANVVVGVALSKLSQSKTAAASIKTLAESKNVFTVNLTNGSSGFKPDNAEKAYAKQMVATGLKKEGDESIKGGSGGTIQLNLTEPVFQKGSLSRVSGGIMNLAHELLGHGLDANNEDANDHMVGVKTNQSEMQATHAENKIRSELGIPLRTYYGREKAWDGNGQSFWIGVDRLTIGTKSILYPGYDYDKENPNKN